MQMSSMQTAAAMRPAVWAWFVVLACVSTPAVAFASPRNPQFVLASEAQTGSGGGDNASPKETPTRALAGAGARRARYGDKLPEEASALRLTGRLMFGLGGELDETVAGGDYGPYDMLTTYGFSLGIEAPVHPYILLGGFVQFAKWNTEGDDENGVDRSTLWEVVAFPKLRYPVVSGDHVLELYAGPVLGASNNSLDEEYGGDVATSAFGLTVGVCAGAAYFVSPDVGLSFEIGYQHRSYSFGGDADVELSFGQLGVNAGVLVTL